MIKKQLRSRVTKSNYEAELQYITYFKSIWKYACLNACTNSVLKNFLSVSQTYSEHFQTFKKERFAETLNSF